MKNVAKRFVLGAICLATAISAFGGISAFNNNVGISEGLNDVTTPVFQEEQTTAINVKDFVETTTATVTQEEFTSMITANTTTTTHNALTIRSDTSYDATFKMVFTGNSEFTFRFAETGTTLYGDFKFHVEDVTDPTNCFDLIYYVRKTSAAAESNWTGLYVQYKDQKRTTSTSANSTDSVPANKIVTSGESPVNDFLPHFLSRGNKSTRRAKLYFNWNSSGVLTIQTYGAKSPDPSDNLQTVAKFDGTETFSPSTKTWGLPKISFPNGYKITVSSDFTKSGVEDHGSDVCFSSIVNNGTTYDFNTATEVAKNNNTKAYTALTAQENAGKLFLGWEDANGALNTTATAIKSADIAAYTPRFLGFDKINGASVRIESAGRSGIRFMTLFNKNDYLAISESSFVTSFGTLVGHTATINTLGKDFTIENYAEEATVKKIANTNGVYSYKDKSTGTQYIAYSLAIVDLAEASYTKSYSARGYIEVAYADGTTKIFYTDFDITNNSRSIAQVAYNLKTIGEAEYNGYTPERKAIVDAYATAYVVPEVTE